MVPLPPEEEWRHMLPVYTSRMENFINFIGEVHSITIEEEVRVEFGYDTYYYKPNWIRHATKEDKVTDKFIRRVKGYDREFMLYT